MISEMDLPESEQNSETPLTFYAAYRQVGDLKNYLGNGKGGVRLFKSRELLEAWLREKLPPADFDQIIIHPVEGMIAVPEPDPETGGPMVPITTLYPDFPPTAEEFFEEIKKPGRHRHKPRGQA